MTRDAATQRQVDAAVPGRSTWLSANAGSGKTRVLTDRVARLLLDEVAPENVLCLTYTKAAATEMQNRLFKRLGAWAMLPDDRLAEELSALGVERRLDRTFLQIARTLFARAIETPGGLRIQTIHSFCASLLRRFPLEAGVSPGFREVEDREAELLRAGLLDRLSAGPEAPLVADFAAQFTGSEDGIDTLLTAMLGRKAAFLPPRAEADLRAAYGLSEGYDEAALLSEVFLGGEVELAAQFRACLGTGKVSDANTAEALARCVAVDRDGLLALESAFLKKDGGISSRAFTKDARAAAEPLIPRIEALMARVEAARPRRLGLEAAERDRALHRFACAFIPAYEAEKARRGVLDFDDLIERANALLAEGPAADWVLYKLDGGIDHILVDEAQDTAPVQWQVIERLAREFTSGRGARDGVTRTIFVVGDKKQSIYSFQGADPSAFDRMRDAFAERLDATGPALQRLTLAHSFRSAPAILSAVDATFEGRDASGFAAEERHIPFHDTMPGRVDLWPVVEKASGEEDGPWYEPVDRPAATHHDVVLARRVARFIADTLAAETPLPVPDGQGGWAARPVQAGDVLILVRRRSSGPFREIIRACKEAGLPIAGADRLRLMAELAVKDIGALLAFLATPADDLSLAAALRSPLFGFSEQALFDLAHRRPPRQGLWEALRRRGAEWPGTRAILDDLRDAAEFLRPYDLIERVLTRHDGRRRLIGRLGAEAEDGIDALLAQALAFEEGQVPSLTGFLQWMQTDDMEIKRSPESAGGRIRVMTVHGAKGLEAPIVILPDCGKPDTNLRDMVLPGERGALWRASGEAKPGTQRDVEAVLKARAAEERDRLLYVAMTRAERWLIVAAAGDIGKDGSAWHAQVADGMARAGAVNQRFDFGDLGGGEGLALGDGWNALARRALPPPAAPAPEFPALFRVAPPVATPRPDLRSPSDLGGAKALPGAAGDETEAAQARGTALHALLEALAPLPAAERATRAPAVLATVGADPAAGPALLAEVGAVLDMPDFAPLFAPETLAEVPVAGELPGLGPVHGIVDRLIVTPGRVTVVDFKSNRTVPATPESVPEGLLRQMGAYAALLGGVYPGREIVTALLWTAAPRLMTLPHGLVSAALARAGAP